MSKIKSIITAFAVTLSFLFTSCDKDVNVSGVQIAPEEVTLGIDSKAHCHGRAFRRH